MLWNVVYEFFVKYIFGGALYNQGIVYKYGGFLGASYNRTSNLWVGYLDTQSLLLYDFTADNGTTYGVSLGNYLSLIATIIAMVVILVLCCALIKKIYNICAHVIG